MRIFDLINKIREYIYTPDKPVPSPEELKKLSHGDGLEYIGEINKKLDKLDENLEFIENYLSKKFKTFEKKA